MLCLCEAPSGVLSSGVGPPTRKIWRCWSIFRGQRGPDRKMIRGLEYFSCAERWSGLGLFSLEERRLRRDVLAIFQYPTGTYKKVGEGHFFREYSDRTRDNGFKLK